MEKKLHFFTYVEKLLKTNLKMKLSILLFIFTLLSVQANTYSQNKKISMKVENQSIEKVLEQIEAKSAYRFFYKTDEINVARKVSLDVTKTPVSKILDIIFKDDPISYTKLKKQIVLKEETGLLKENVLDKIIQQTVTGKVTDETGEPVFGATVVVKGTTNGVSTDTEGNFSIQANSGDIIEITYVGYAKYVINVTTNTSFVSVSLKEQNTNLEEVVLVGYGQTRKKDLTGTVTTVKAEEIAQIKTQTIDQALVGRVPGVHIQSISGKPGAGSVVHIRGLSALRGDNQPLYVVDGVPMIVNPVFESTGLGTFGNRENPLMAINPNDVERVDVLKDASAAAIYGSRAANGVILVTTKRGKRGAKPRFTFSLNSTFQNPTKKWDPLNATQYRAFTTEQAQARIDGGTGTPLDDTIIDGSFFGNENTNWQDLITNDNALWNDYRFGVSGGTDNVNYLVSANITDQEGIMLGSELKRYNFAANLDADITDYLRVGASVNYNHSVNKASNVQGLSQGFFRPDKGIFEPNGEYTSSPAPFGPNPFQRNPVGGAAEVRNRTISQNIFGSIYAEIKIVEGLKFKSLLSVSTNNDKTDNFIPSFAFRAGTNPDNGGPEAVLEGQTNAGYSTSFTNTLNYNTEFDGGHRLDVVAGISWDQNRLDLESQTYQGFPDDYILTNIRSANAVTGYGSESIENGLNSLFGRVNYNYKDRYLATFTARRDGSTKFGSNNQFGFFPSGALAWNVHNEDFFSSEKISQLKLRASLGRVGSDNLASFSYLAYLSSLANNASIYNGQNGIAINGLPNPDIKWEETDQLDLGLEFGLFNNRLNGEVVYFEKNTNGIILFTPLPSETGSASFNSNIADVSNKGWEITIGGDVIRKENFNWNSSFNISFVKNNVDALNGGTVFNTGNGRGVVEGMPLGTMVGYDVVGIA